ncbi:hypothetical protein PN416_16885 [Halorubrum ezzemoulense]|uniref:hypothetical protein n=1 Tax=Halorubrum ezzemoulense TaxID=337243 RepID=UPI00232F982B|nr:hypothetical protein [Halorubrum ezzemoulense]MDB9285073.1 hypothetical protein [Halorubrum ezzemoulense]
MADGNEEEYNRVVENLSESEIVAKINSLEREVSEIEDDLEIVNEKLSNNEDHPDVAYERRANLEETRREKQKRIAELRSEVVDKDNVLRQVDVVSEAETIISRLEEIEAKWDIEIDDALHTKSDIKATHNRILNLEDTAQSLLEETTSTALGQQFRDSSALNVEVGA